MAIIHGHQVENTMANSVVKIQFHWKQNPDMPCSATVIGQHSLLTAAHCVDKINLNTSIKVIINGQEALKVKNIFVPMKYYNSIEQYHRSTNYQDRLLYHRQTALYDLAIVNLQLKLPKNLKPVRLDFRPINAGKAVEIVGSGLTQYHYINKYFYQETDKPLKRSQYLEILANGVYMAKGNTKIDFITAPGDSGGALFLANTLNQIGVIRGSSATPDVSASIFTPIWKHKKFILKYKN